MLTVRDALETDFEKIMEIYRSAQQLMIESGNPTQWGHTYPSEELIHDDIKNHICKVVCDEDDIHGVFALCEGEDPTYGYIEGAWLDDEPYIAIHRVASDGQVRGILACAVSYTSGMSRNIKIDTHADNLRMQHLIEKRGFTKCGTIYVEDGSPRIAYQRCK